MAKKNEKNLPANWDEELARQAQVAAGMENSTATGQFFSLKGGTLSWNDAPLPNNQMAVIIVDSILENVFYEGRYDPDTPQAPSCFAFGRDDKEMKPHELVFENNSNQHDFCSGCEMNEWGTAETGRGKACRNVRRLAMIPAGILENGKFKIFEEDDHFESTAIGFMKLPVTSVKGYAAFVKQIAGALKRPPHGVITRVSVVPDSKSQFKVTFEPIMSVPNEIMRAVMKRHEEAQSVIDFPYALDDGSQPEPPKKGAKGKTSKRKY